MTTQATRARAFPDGFVHAGPFVVVGAGCVVVGGLVSAIAASSPSENSSWAVAYLVLVAGVAQIALGAGQSHLAATRPSPRILIAEFVAWNLGNAAVVAGQLLRIPPIIDAGGVLLAVGLALFFRSVRGAVPAEHSTMWMLYVYRVILLIVLVSIPVGLVLGHVKAA